MPGKNRRDFLAEYKASLERLRLDDNERFREIAPFLYTPDPRIAKMIKELDKYFIKQNKATAAERKLAGKKMEQLATLVFASLEGVAELRSFTSPGGQYDLVVNGNNADWLSLCSFIRIDQHRRGILVEVKATADKIDDHQFGRLCELLRCNFPATMAMGVFFTHSGATGFPTNPAHRLGQLQDAHLRQALFYAQCRTPVVVLVWADIKTLGSAGALPIILGRKVSDLEASPGVPSSTDLKGAVLDLPPHLAELLPVKKV